jgi:hypothetical protein
MPGIMLLTAPVLRGILASAALWTAAATVASADPPTVAVVREHEFKLYVTAENTARAVKLLKLEDRSMTGQTVCFFDTADGALAANHLILRARQNTDKPGAAGESTVKIRAVEGETLLSPLELAISPEQDWSRPDAPTLSRSVTWKLLENGKVSKIAEGEGKVIDLFNPEQRALVAARMPGFKWEILKRYGPIDAQVWKGNLKLEGLPQKVTVEIWNLKKDGRILSMLEISTKATADTDAQARAQAKDFFAAAKAAGLGEPVGQTKTSAALDFFRPGR